MSNVIDMIDLNVFLREVYKKLDDMELNNGYFPDSCCRTTSFALASYLKYDLQFDEVLIMQTTLHNWIVYDDFILDLTASQNALNVYFKDISKNTYVFRKNSLIYSNLWETGSRKEVINKFSDVSKNNESEDTLKIYKTIKDVGEPYFKKFFNRLRWDINFEGKSKYINYVVPYERYISDNNIKLRKSEIINLVKSIYFFTRKYLKIKSELVLELNKFLQRYNLKIDSEKSIKRYHISFIDTTTPLIKLNLNTNLLSRIAFEISTPALKRDNYPSFQTSYIDHELFRSKELVRFFNVYISNRRYFPDGVNSYNQILFGLIMNTAFDDLDYFRIDIIKSIFNVSVIESEEVDKTIRRFYCDENTHKFYFSVPRSNFYEHVSQFKLSGTCFSTLILQYLIFITKGNSGNLLSNKTVKRFFEFCDKNIFKASIYNYQINHAPLDCSNDIICLNTNQHDISFSMLGNVYLKDKIKFNSLFKMTRLSNDENYNVIEIDLSDRFSAYRGNSSFLKSITTNIFINYFEVKLKPVDQRIHSLINYIKDDDLFYRIEETDIGKTLFIEDKYVTIRIDCINYVIVDCFQKQSNLLDIFDLENDVDLLFQLGTYHLYKKVYDYVYTNKLVLNKNLMSIKDILDIFSPYLDLLKNKNHYTLYEYDFEIIKSRSPYSFGYYKSTSYNRYTRYKDDNGFSFYLPIKEYIYFTEDIGRADKTNSDRVIKKGVKLGKKPLLHPLDVGKLLVLIDSDNLQNTAILRKGYVKRNEIVNLHTNSVFQYIFKMVSDFY